MSQGSAQLGQGSLALTWQSLPMLQDSAWSKKLCLNMAIPPKVMAKFMKFFLNHVRNGVEAMDVCVQDPPKSDVDLEGA